MAFGVQAKVEHPAGLSSIKSVSVDMSTLGGNSVTPLYDDGAHGDGGAGDGVYGAPVRFSAHAFGQEGALRRAVRGKIGLSIEVKDKHGLSDSWPVVVSILSGPKILMVYGADGAGMKQLVEGPVSLRSVRNEGVRPDEYAAQIAATGPGPWRAGWVSGGGQNIAGCKTLSFYIRGDRSQEVFVHLTDHHQSGPDGYFDEPHFSAPVPLLAGG